MGFLPEPLFHFNYLFYTATVFWIFAFVALWSTSGMPLRVGGEWREYPRDLWQRPASIFFFAAVFCGAVVLVVPVTGLCWLLTPLAVCGVVVFVLAACQVSRILPPGFPEHLQSWLRWALLAQAGSALLTAWGAVFAARSVADLLDTSGYEWLAMAGFLALAAAACTVVTLLRWARQAFDHPGLNRDLKGCVMLLLLVVMGGWLLCTIAGAQARKEIEERYLSRVRIAALSLPSKLVGELANPSSPDLSGAHERVVALLHKIIRADGQAEYAYLWTIKNGWMTFLADADRLGTENNTPPWLPYRQADSEDVEAFQSLFPYFNEPFVDDWGVLVSSNEPVWGEDGAKLCWLGIDYPAQVWFSHVFNAMSLVFLGSALAVLAILFGLGLRMRGIRALTLSLEADRAAAADRAKTEFIACLSHDLRTPLQAIAGCVDLLSQDAPDKSALLVALKDNTSTLLRFHEDILDFSALREEMLHIRREPFDLASLCRAVALNGRRLCQAKGLFFQWSLSKDFPASAIGDPLRLRQILTNLLDNAAKFTAKGSVEMHCSLEGKSRLLFVVEDTGPGIPQERQAVIFEPFERAGAREPGTGLGLAIVKRLSALLGGSIELEKRDGGGSRFVVDLPYFPAEKAVIMEAGSPSLLLPKAGKALILDDHSEVRMVFEGYLRALGWEVKGCADIERARGEMSWNNPQLFLVDVSLPDGSVLDFIREIRRLRPKARILCVSAATDDETVSATLDAGADDFLHKPITFEAFSEALRGISLSDALPPALSEVVELGSKAVDAENWSEVALIAHRLVNVTFALSVSGSFGDFTTFTQQCGIVEKMARSSDEEATKEAWIGLLKIYADMGPISQS